MNTIADYTEWKLRKQQAGANAANIVLQSSQGSPDEIAGDLNLANEFGKVTGNPVPPLPMVQEYRSVFQQKIEEARNKTILSNAPRLADWLRNPENAALSRDDLERLAWFERFGLYPKDAAGVSFGQGLANTLSYAGEQLTQMYNQFMMEQTQGRARDRELTFADILKEESQTDLVGPDGQRLETWDGSNFLRAAARWIDAQYAELIGSDDKAASEEYAKRLGETLNTMRAIPKSDIASQFETDAMKEGASFGEAVVNFATAFARNPMGGMAWAIETAGRSAPQLAAALATTVLTRNPIAGAGVAAGGSYLTERYVSPAEFFDEHGIDLTKQEDVQRLLNDPKLMEDAAKRGVIRGLVIGAFDALSMGVAGKTLANNPLVEALAQGATQMVLGAAGEYAARVAAGQEIDWNDVLAEGLAEIATTPIDLGIAGRRVQIMRRQAREAEEQRTVAEAMSNAAKVSALRNRMPERFRDFVARATEGGAVENVYVPAEQFVQYFQDLGADPWALVDDLDGVTRDDLDAALAAGGDLRIPTATYAAKIAGSDHDAWFLDNLKFDPEQMSTAEAAEFNARVQDIMEEAWEEAEAIRREMEAHRTYEEEIYDTVVSRLRAAGQATDVSTTQAQLYARMYLAMADRAKMTVEEFMRRYPLPEIRGALPEGAKFRDVDELTRILAAARARRSPLTVKRGMSLLEFIAERGGIRDVGGDVRSILGGQTEIKRGRGRKTLKIVRDDSYDDTGSLFGGGPKVDEKGRAHGLDDVAQAAIEAGYLADHPDVVAWKAAVERGDQVPDIRNALLEAIDEELRGRHSYSIDDQVDQRAIEEDEFYDQFDEYLNRLGVSLDDPDDVIREAIRKDEEARRAEMEDARMYGQNRENLIVQHNLTAANLIHADKMRGLAVPSLAISNVDYPLDNFGEITLLAGPDLIDPRKDRTSKVFDADVYSPRYPTVRYKIAKPAMNKVWKRLGKVSAELGHVLSGELDNGEVERKGLEAFRDSSAVQLEFLRSTGRNIELPQNTARTDYLTMVPELADMFVDAYSVANDPAVKEAVERAINLQIQKLHDAAPDIPVEEWRDQYYLRGEIRRSVLDDINQEKRVLRDPGVDRRAARRVIRDAVQPHADEFAKWVEDQFGDVIAGEQVVTETASGDLRYLPHTLDNVVKIMRKKLRDGEGFNYGVGSIRSTVANQFKSVSAIQAARGRLIPADDMKALKDEIDDEFVALAGKLGAYSDFSDGFGWLDTFGEQLKELAQSGPRAFKQYFNDLPDDLLQEAASFLQKLANLPTEYFEAKLQRAVDLSEFKAAVIPTNAPQEVKNILEYARVPVIEYDPNVTGARSAAIRRASMEHRLLFQSAPPVDSEAFKRWFGDSKVVDENGEPLVMYHGTPAMIGEDFAFDPRRISERGSASGYGFYFTSDRATAEGYKPEDGGSLAEVYLSIQKPLPVDAKAFPKSTIAKIVERLIEKDIAENGSDWRDTFVSNFVDTYSMSRAAAVRETASMISEGSEKAIDQIAEIANVYGSKDDAMRAVRDVTGYDGIFTDGYDNKGSEGGKIFVAWFPEQIKSVHNRGTWDPNDPRILYQTAYHGYEQNRSGGARGAISYRFDGERLQRLIQLFEKADLSTFLHEAGHDFLIILRDLANFEVMQGYADRPIGEMYDVVRNWWLENAKDIVVEAKKARGIDVSEADVQAFINNGTTGDTVKDEAIDVGVNEYWARGFEAYLMEGKAPSEALRGTFEKFRAWLLSVYAKIIQIVGRDPSRVMGVNLNDDIRGVFDRMQATDEEIAKAQQKTGGISPVFTTAEQLGMTDEEYQRFLKLREKAEDEARAKVLAEIMAPVKRQTERWYKEERAKVREQVEREVNSWRVYRAIEWMGNRRWLGDGQPEGLPDVRLSKDILVKRYGEGVLKTLPRGQQTVYTVDGGVDPDDVAGWFGFSSGDEMIQAMESAPRRVEAIEAETDKRMRELHGDPLNDGSIEVMALDAVHTEKRGEWIAAELKAVNEVAGLDLALTYKQAREMARQTVARMRVRDAMASNRYLAAERKAADEAERLAKMLGRNSTWMNAARRRIQSKAKAALREEASPDAVARQIDQANRSTENYNEIAERFVQAKRRQLINHALYMESRRVSEEVEKAENFVRKLNKASHREKIAGAGRREDAQIDYLAAIDEILERYDFRRMSARQEERRASLVEFVEAMKAAGRESELAIPDKVLRDSQRRPYKTLTVEELRGVVDSLKNLEHIALRWNKLIDEKRQRDFDEARGTIISTILENKPTKDKQWVKDTGVKISLLDGAKEYLASLQTATTILRGLDGDKDIGPVYDLLKTPLDEAAYAEREMLADAAKKLEELYSLYSVDEQREMAVKRHYPELGGSFSKWNLIMMGLNMGNEGNLARLTNQRARKHLTEAQVEIVKNLLDERDARFIQGVWDLIGSYRDAIAKRERRQKGVEPNWVEAKPVTIGGVELRGGYFPIKYARDLGGGSEIAADMSYDDILASMMGGRFSGTHTKDGHLKERAANTDMSLLLDTSVIGRHLVEVIHDLTHSEAIVNATRLLADREVRQAFIDTGLESQYEQLRLWVQDAAVGQVSQSDFYSKAIQKLRSGFTFSKLAINLKTILLQPLGLSQSAVVVGKARLMRNVMKFWSDPRAMRDQVVAKSRIMWERERTFNKDIMDMVADANVSSPSASKIRDFRDQYIVPLGMAGITFTQFYTVDMPVWMAAYEKGLEIFGGDDAKAVHYADMTVERTQGSGLFINRAGIERGTTSQKRRQDPFVLLLTTLGSYFFAKLNVAITRTRELRAQQITPVEAVNYALDMLLLFSFEAVVMTLAGELFGGGGDDDDDSIAAEIVKETAKTVTGGLPVVRDLAGMMEGFEGGTYGAILKIFADTFRNTAKDVKNTEVRKTTVKNAVNLMGMLGRLPSTQINRVIDAAWREADGEDVAPVEYLFGRQKR